MSVAHPSTHQPAVRVWITPAFLATCLVLVLLSMVGVDASQFFGRLPWACLGLALALCCFTVAQGRAAERLAMRRMWSDPDSLAIPAPVWAGFDGAAALVAFVLLALRSIQLFFPSPFHPGPGVLAVVVGGLASCAAATAVFFLIARRWSVFPGLLALALMSLGVAELFTVFAGTDPQTGKPNLPAQSAFTMLGLAVIAVIWTWLAGVWQQQLDGGAPWTPAGRLLAVLPIVVWIVTSFGVAVGLRIAIIGHSPERAPFLGTGAFIASAVGSLMLVVALRSAGKRWNRPLGMSLAMMAAVSLAFLCFAQYGR